MTLLVLMPQILRQAWNLVPSVTRSRLYSVTGMAAANRQPEDFSMAFVTAPSSDVAKQIAGGLVSNKLAACVNIIPGEQQNLVDRYEVSIFSCQGSQVCTSGRGR